MHRQENGAGIILEFLGIIRSRICNKKPILYLGIALKRRKNLRLNVVDSSLRVIEEDKNSFVPMLRKYFFKIVYLRRKHGFESIGANGEGKSTFMNIITGKLMPDEGKVEWSKNVRVGYLDQHTVLEKGMTIRDVLASAFQFLFEMEQEMNGMYFKRKKDWGTSIRYLKDEE